MNTERMARDRRRPRGLPGNALIEFILTLPIIIFMTGLTIYMSMAMLTKQQTLVEARYHLYRAAGHGDWSPMLLEGFNPTTTTAADASAGHMPRGSGEELDRLRSEVEPTTIEKATNAKARAYWERLWSNLPGRHDTLSERSFETARLWSFISRTARADHWRDSSPWHFYHVDAWQIARSGPLREVFEAFRMDLRLGDSDIQNELQGSPQVQAETLSHFAAVRAEIIRRWWHGADLLTDNDSVGQGG